MDSSPRKWQKSCSRFHHLRNWSCHRTWCLCALLGWAGVQAQVDTPVSVGLSPAASWWASGRIWIRRHRCNPAGNSAPYLDSKQPADTKLVQIIVPSLHRQSLTWWDGYQSIWYFHAPFTDHLHFWVDSSPTRLWTACSRWFVQDTGLHLRTGQRRARPRRW